MNGSHHKVWDEICHEITYYNASDESHPTPGIVHSEVAELSSRSAVELTLL